MSIHTTGVVAPGEAHGDLRAGDSWIAMEFLSGGSLQSRVPRSYNGLRHALTGLLEAPELVGLRLSVEMCVKQAERVPFLAELTVLEHLLALHGFVEPDIAEICEIMATLDPEPLARARIEALGRTHAGR